MSGRGVDTSAKAKVPKDDLRADLDEYSLAVRESRADARDARARIERAATMLEAVRQIVFERRRHAAKRAAKRERRHA